jgi:hypothetical protein
MRDRERGISGHRGPRAQTSGCPWPDRNLADDRPGEPSHETVVPIARGRSLAAGSAGSAPRRAMSRFAPRLDEPACNIAVTEPVHDAAGSAELASCLVSPDSAATPASRAETRELTAASGAVSSPGSALHLRAGRRFRLHRLGHVPSPACASRAAPALAGFALSGHRGAASCCPAS